MTESAQLREAGAVLFDLDGTLVDTAPDMVAVLQELQIDHGRDPVDYVTARSFVSNGALGLVGLAFPDATEDFREQLYHEYLDRYELTVCRKSTLFPGLAEMLEELERRACPWGVVTNKPARMTQPLLQQLGLGQRASCAVSGDTLPQRKPHPAPLLHASELLRVSAENTVYVGDALRDIEAGRAAGMQTIAAAYGYIVSGDDPLSWKADFIVASAPELAEMLIAATQRDTR